MLIASVFVGVCFRLIPSHADWQGGFARDAQIISAADLAIPRLLHEVAKRDELYFSPNVEIGVDYDDLPRLCVARKIVYPITSIHDVATHAARKAAADFGQPAQLRMLIDLRDPPADWPSRFQSILGKELLHNERCSIWEIQVPSDSQ